MTYSMTPLLALVGVRIKEFFREPGAIFWTFGFPLVPLDEQLRLAA